MPDCMIASMICRYCFVAASAAASDETPSPRKSSV
jgi:hypothetical protein